MKNAKSLSHTASSNVLHFIHSHGKCYYLVFHILNALEIAPCTKSPYFRVVQNIRVLLLHGIKKMWKSPRDRIVFTSYTIYIKHWVYIQNRFTEGTLSSLGRIRKAILLLKSRKNVECRRRQLRENETSGMG